MKNIPLLGGGGLPYVRDAQGNVLGVYEYKANTAGALTHGEWTEQHLYGSSRLGMLTPKLDISNHLPNAGFIENVDDHTQDIGKRIYELTNHLGNVMATVSDKKIGHDNGSETIDYYEADVVSANDYYPFGMGMPGRGFGIQGRHGFNGMERDNDIKGEGNAYTTLHRIYDPRLGRWLSVDPEQDEYPDETPYAGIENDPINESDPDGDCPWCIAFLKGVVQEYATQVVTNLVEGKGLKASFTQVNGKEILTAGVTDMVTLGVGSLIGKAKTAVKLVKAADKAVEVEKTAVKVNKVAKTTKKVAKVEKNVVKAEWKGKIVGKAQKTKTAGHQFRSYREAITAAKDPNVKKVYLDKGYNKVADLKPGTIKPNRRPDVSVVKKDGTIDAIEVQSRTDNPTNLINRNKEAMQKLPANKQGDIKVVKPTKSGGE